ncbi:MAG TPA: phosphohydrolase [Solibacterales bacterium]|nr:phosphohydrolase [Bryobacterales bacterium]
MQHNAEAVVDEVIALLTRSGGEQYFGEAVSKLAHAEQCAWQAEQAGADDELVLAALLHDVGHLLDDERAQRDERVGVINHDELGAQWLRERGFAPRLARLVGAHVNAKRYLTATNETYMGRLSPASQETLRLQGGPMNAAEAAQFAEEPELRDMLRLRSWDEMAKDPEWRGPGAESYRARLAAHLERQR